MDASRALSGTHRDELNQTPPVNMFVRAKSLTETAAACPTMQPIKCSSHCYGSSRAAIRVFQRKVQYEEWGLASRHLVSSQLWLLAELDCHVLTLLKGSP